jgi:Carbohydrate-selective porin, OprB family
MGLAIAVLTAQPLKAQPASGDQLAVPLLAAENRLGNPSDSNPTVAELEALVNAKAPQTPPASEPATPAPEPPKRPFNPTTQLEGEVLYSILGVGSEASDTGPDTGYRVRLNLDTSFTGRDRLRVRFQSVSTPRPDRIADTDLARISFQGDSGGQFELSRLEYTFPIGRRTTVYLEGAGGSLNDFADTLSPYVSGSAKGSLSRFGQRNPIYRQGEGVGLGFTHEFSKQLSFSAGYLTRPGTDPLATDAESAYSAIAQLTYKPTKALGIGLTYVHSYNGLDTSTGSAIANDPFDNDSEAVRANSLGVQTNLKLNSRLSLGGWVGFTQAIATDLPGKPQASIVNWAVTVAFPDLGKKGNLGALIIGQPPQTFRNSFQEDGAALVDSDTSLHIEAFYRIQVQKNIALTLGGWMVTNPEGNGDRSPLFVGAVRTTFSF